MYADRIQTTLTDTFGFDDLRPGQRAAIEDVLAGAPVLTVMPTGAGKSLCYQLPAVVLGATGAVTLVVSPLIALMKDQVDSLVARGVEAAQLSSACTPAEQADVLEGIRSGAHTIVYVAPERFRSPRFIDALASLGDRLGLLAIDEAHCISEWGHEFRPDYRRLGEAVASLRPPRLVALTATATPEVRADIVRQLGMAEPRVHVHGFDRPNLHYRVEPCGGAADKADRVVDIVRRRVSGVALVYAATRKNAERYAAALGERGMRSRVYHAGLGDAERSRAQDEFMSGALDVIVATNAFGMGVDKGDIHTVVHADLPRSVEAFYQESGRGGRDGERTECVLLFNHADVRLQEFLIDASYPSADTLRGVWKALREQPALGHDVDRLRFELPGEPHASTVSAAIRILTRHGYLNETPDGIRAVRPQGDGEHQAFDVNALARRADVERNKLRSMVDYGYHPRCRRQYMLDYFGDSDWADPMRRCSACDNCKGLGQAADLSDEQRDQCTRLLALVDRLDGRFGRTRLAKIANGTDDDHRLDELPERGCLRGVAARYLMDLFRALEGAGLLIASRGEYPTLGVTRQGQAVLRGEADIDRLGMMPAAKSTRRKSKRAPVVAFDPDDPIDAGAVERLRNLRSSLASERSVPAYVIFSNKTLEALARAMPATLDELAGVHGIGPSKVDTYGASILAALQGEDAPPG